MPLFISKVQHDIYEKGEFSDEKERTLDETLELVRTFPWDKERNLTDIQLTGPSITIQDEYVNYLKVGIYFGGKYCVYYLDNDNNLYERYVTNIDDVLSLVTDFFNNQLDLEKFDKHLFNFGNQGHFATRYFEYRSKAWRILSLNVFMIAWALMILIFVIAILKVEIPSNDIRLVIKIIIIPISLLFYYILAKILYKAFINRNNYLQISKGHDKFSFGYNADNITTYNKTDILNIVQYVSSGSRNPNLIEVYEINFKDGRKIKFSNMLISGSILYSKFTDKMGNNYIQIINGNKNPLKMI